MSWRIHLVVNTLVTTVTALDDIMFCGGCDYDWATTADIGVAKGNVATLKLNEDNMEHMDYLSRTDVQEVLKKHKAKGDVCFASHEGDNKGKIWGYRFDGKGGMEKLTGVILFRPVTLRKCPAPKKGVTTKVTRKVTKRAPVGKKPVVKGKMKLTCVSCAEDGHPAHDIGDRTSKRPYCRECGSDKHVKKVRV